MKARDFLLGVSAVAACLAGCVEPGGSGSEDTNGSLTGRLTYADGSPAVGTRIRVRAEGYLQDTSRIGDTLSPPDAIANRGGYFRIDSLDTGAYCLEATDASGKGVLLKFKVDQDGKTVELPAAALRPGGTLAGRLELQPGTPSRPIVQVYGLERSVRADSQGYFAFRGLPAGEYRLKAVSDLPGTAYQDPDAARLGAGDTLQVPVIPLVAFDSEDYSTWPHSRSIHLRTSAVGLTGTVKGYPLLVTLDSTRFDFGGSDGKDIRFASPDGAPLRFQLDTWEPGSGSAAFWVRLDSLSAGDTNASIRMYWGKQDAPDFSDGPAVFGDFAGVWHLSEKPDAGGEAQVRDASPTGAHGEAHVAAENRQGRMGPAARFLGAESIRIPGKASLRPLRHLTLTLWVHVVGFSRETGELLSMGDDYGIRVGASGGTEFFLLTDSTLASGPSQTDSTLRESCFTPVPDLWSSGWHHVAGVYDGSSMHLFIDGAEMASLRVDKDMVYRTGSGLPGLPGFREFRIGAHGTDLGRHNLQGYLDEVRVAGQPRSSDWIKLEYASQRPGSDFLEFR